MQSIKKIEDIKGKFALVRLDLNLPIENGKVEDDFRVKKEIPTVEFLAKKGAKIILISHLGKGGESLAPVAKVLNKFLEVKFIPQVLGEEVIQARGNMKNGEIILLENLLNELGENKSDQIFAMSFAT